MDKNAARRPNADSKALKPYSKPTLNKGPVLSRITADDGGSGRG
jgi:hypothetical protein